MTQAMQKSWSKQDLLNIARWQKNVIWMILLSVGMLMLMWSMPPGLARVVLTLPYVAGGIVQGYFIYRLARALRSQSAPVYALLMLVPLVGIAALLSLNSQATTRLQAHHIRVGIMGAEMADFDRMA